jgi:hypothetical protein
MKYLNKFNSLYYHKTIDNNFYKIFKKKICLNMIKKVLLKIYKKEKI